MTFPVIVLPPAEADIAAAIRYYDQLRSGHGELFLVELDRTFALISLWPEGCERVTRHLRRALIHEFTEAVIYRPLDDQIRVLRVLSTYRDPAILKSINPAA